MTNPEQIPSRRSPKAAAGDPVPSAIVLGCAWLALVAVAVIGRLWQPSWNGEPLWNATPLAGVALAAGFVFPNVLVAATVPLAALAISNLALPAYGGSWSIQWPFHGLVITRPWPPRA